MCIILPIFTPVDWHDMLPITRSCIAVTAVVFIIWVLKRNRPGGDSLERHLQLVGIGVLSFATVLEVVRYLTVGDMDRAYVLRIGFLIFILCFGGSSLMSMYRLIAQGMEYDSVHKLAYLDGLTKLGNRAAYLEQLQNFVREQIPTLGIVFLDINNLKFVNDTGGHNMGDELIKAAAKAISESFGVYGKVYRIGGDEFCVLIANESAEEQYGLAMEKFRKNIRRINEKNNGRFELQIARGFAVCAADSMGVVDIALKAADAEMYQHKAELKTMSSNT